MKRSKKNASVYSPILKQLTNEQSFSPRSIARLAREQGMLSEHVYRYRWAKWKDAGLEEPTEGELDGAEERFVNYLMTYRSRFFPKGWKGPERIRGQTAYWGWQWKTLIPDPCWNVHESQCKQEVLNTWIQYEQNQPGSNKNSERPGFWTCRFGLEPPPIVLGRSSVSKRKNRSRSSTDFLSPSSNHWKPQPKKVAGRTISRLTFLILAFFLTLSLVLV